MRINDEGSSPFGNLLISIQAAVSARSGHPTLTDVFGSTGVEYTDQYADTAFIVGVGTMSPEAVAAMSVYSAQRDRDSGISDDSIRGNLSIGVMRSHTAFRCITETDIGETAHTIIEDWDASRYGSDDLEQLRDFITDAEGEIPDQMILRLVVRALQDSYAAEGEDFPFLDAEERGVRAGSNQRSIEDDWEF